MDDRGPLEGHTVSVESGQILAHYHIVDKIGEGGMGVVWRAVDTRLQREVALKVLPPDLADTHQRLQRFEREARTVAALNHPNIVTIYSIEEADGVRFFTMELVRGKTLAQLIPRHGLTLQRFFELALPLTDALSAAHVSGIVHRDLKPANIIIGDDGRLKILDFGLAKLRGPEAGQDDVAEAPTRTAAPLTRTGQVVGTTLYMSPEQLQGEEVDPRTDIFSLGIILYEMATGQRPFSGASAAGVISSILRDTPPVVTEIKAELPNQLARIVRHCLEKNPERRMQTAKDARNELEDLQAEVLTGVTSRSKKFDLGPRRRRPVAAVAITAGLLLLALWAFWGRDFSPEPPSELTTVAVLPFDNLTGVAEQDYLSEGIGSALISRLGELSAVRVISAASGNDQEFRETAHRLGVAALLEGEVQQAGEELRVNVKLTAPGTGVVLWSEVFEGSGEELFALQRTMARRLADIIAVPLTRGEQRRLGRDSTRSFKAYDHFLRGRKLLDDVSDPGNVDLAVEMFRQALRVDSGFALAHAALSEALWASYYHDAVGSKLEEAEQAAERALRIDPGLPAAQLALARVHGATGRYDQSIEALRHALAEHPKPAEAYRELARSHQRVGELERAETCLEAAAALGGDDWFHWNALGAFFEELGRYDEARAAFASASDRAPPEVSMPHENLAALRIVEGRFDEAIEAYQRIPRPIRDPILASNIGTAYYFSDHPDKWERVEEFYRTAVRLDARDPMIRRNLADLYQELGRADDARHHYREALRLVEEQLLDDPVSYELRLSRGLYAAKSEQCPTAIEQAVALEAELPQTARNMHRMAHVYALCGEEERALRAVRDSIELGVSTEILAQEAELLSLRDNPEFSRLVAASPD